MLVRKIYIFFENKSEDKIVECGGNGDGLVGDETFEKRNNSKRQKGFPYSIKKFRNKTRK